MMTLSNQLGFLMLQFKKGVTIFTTVQSETGIFMRIRTNKNLHDDDRFL